MFKCENCNSNSQPREKQNRVTIETRSKTYFQFTKGLDDEGNEVTFQGKELGVGSEIVREVSVCSKCAKVG